MLAVTTFLSSTFRIEQREKRNSREQVSEPWLAYLYFDHMLDEFTQANPTIIRAYDRPVRQHTQ